MIRTKTVETVEEFDYEGKLLKRTVTETEETDDSPARYTHTSTPYVPPVPRDQEFYKPPVAASD